MFYSLAQNSPVLTFFLFVLVCACFGVGIFFLYSFICEKISIKKNMKERAKRDKSC